MQSDIHTADFRKCLSRASFSHFDTSQRRFGICLKFCLTSPSDVVSCLKADSIRHLLHANRNPPLGIMELRPENPLLLAIIEEAQSSSAAIIPNFGDDRLP